MAKRGKVEIIRDILQIIRDNHNSIRPTPLLRKSNLSSSRFSEYLDELLEKRLVAESMDKKGKKCIILTGRGYRYLEQYKSIVGFIEEFEL